MTSQNRTGAVLGRAAAALLVLGALALAAARATSQAWSSATGPLPRPESGLVALLGAVGTGLALYLAAVVVLVALPHLVGAATGRAPVAPRAYRGAARLVAGLVLGAGTLAPGLASAAPTRAPAVMVQTDGTGAGRAPAAPNLPPDLAPVDPTYLGSQARAGASATTTPPARGATPSAAPDTVPGTESRPGAPAPTPPVLVVQDGDTLWQIAERHLTHHDGPRPDDVQIAHAVGALYAANREAVGSNPDLIQPGTRLVVPDGLPAAGGQVSPGGGSTGPAAGGAR